MIDTDRRVYTPPLDVDDYEIPLEQEEGRRKMMVGAIMAIVVAALAAVAWNTYGNSGAPPLITADAGDFKSIAPQAAPPVVPSHELDDAIEGDKPAAAVVEAAPLTTSAPPQEPVATLAPSTPQAQGAFLAQLAALRTQSDAEAAWRAFSSRAPGLAQGARTQIQRADLGPQGTFYRLRVGYFDTHERAGEFCARAEAAGQACMVVAR